jgi:hypothetical protein
MHSATVMGRHSATYSHRPSWLRLAPGELAETRTGRVGWDSHRASWLRLATGELAETRTGRFGSGNNATDLYPWGTRFESRTGYDLSWLGLLWFLLCLQANADNIVKYITAASFHSAANSSLIYRPIIQAIYSPNINYPKKRGFITSVEFILKFTGSFGVIKRKQLHRYINCTAGMPTSLVNLSICWPKTLSLISTQMIFSAHVQPSCSYCVFPNIVTNYANCCITVSCEWNKWGTVWKSRVTITALPRPWHTDLHPLTNKTWRIYRCLLGLHFHGLISGNNYYLSRLKIRLLNLTERRF